MVASSPPFDVIIDRKAAKFIRKTSRLLEAIEDITNRLARLPFDPQNRHLKGPLNCSRRVRLGDYRLLYRVSGRTRRVVIFDAGIKSEDIYK